MSEDEYEELQEIASAHRLTVSAWVRACIRAAAGGDPIPGPGPSRAGEPGPGQPADGGERGSVSPEALDPELIRRVMERHDLGDAREAIEFALRRAAAPLDRAEILDLSGIGWKGTR